MTNQSESKTPKSQALVVPTTWAVERLKEGSETPLAMAMRQGVRVTDLPRAPIPSGGGIAWTLPTMNGEDVSKELVGVIATAQGKQKAWWRVPLAQGGGNQVPDCTSVDGVHGTGNNSINGEPEHVGTHLCLQCPWDQFKSARRDGGGKGEGKDCKEFTRLFVFRGDDMLPLVVSLPPTSLKPLRTYLLKLAQGGKRLSDVVTRMTLVQVAQPVLHSEVKFEYVQDVSDKARAAFEGYGAVIDDLLSESDTRVDAREVTPE